MYLRTTACKLSLKISKDQMRGNFGNNLQECIVKRKYCKKKISKKRHFISGNSCQTINVLVFKKDVCDRFRPQ